MRQGTAWGYALIAVLTLAAYHNCFSGPFIFDDVPVVRHNPTILKLWPLATPLSPPADLAVAGRPVLNLSFALCHAVSGEAVWSYHAFNLAIHILAGWTLFAVARRTLERLPNVARAYSPCSDPTGCKPVPRFTALAIALLWTLHPLQTGTVTYIAQRSESMMGLFYLLTLYFFIRYSEEKAGKEKAESGKRKAETVKQWSFPLFAVVSCFLGAASKETMVTAPVIVFLYDRTFLSGTFREAWRRHWLLHLGLASSWVLFACLERGLHERGIGTGLGVSPWAYGFGECRVILEYLRLAVWPCPLVLDYGPLVALPAADPVSVLLVFLLLTGTAIALWRRPVLGFIGCWFFVLLAPTSSVVPLVLQPMAENRLYLPLACVVALAVLGVNALRLEGRIKMLLLGLVVLVFGAMTSKRNEDYGTEIGIWRDTVAKRPHNPRAQFNLGVALLDGGQPREAIEPLEQALQIYPSYAEAHYKLGAALAAAGRLPEAIDEYAESLRLKPGLAGARYSLGAALFKTGRLPEAIDQFEEAVRSDPGAVEARADLAMALLQSGQLAESVAQFQEAVRLKPSSAELRNRLGIALAESGRIPDAVYQFEEALRINPRSSQTHINLGSALANENRLDEAVTQYEEALRLDPTSTDAQAQLTQALRLLNHPPSSP